MKVRAIKSVNDPDSEGARHSDLEPDKCYLVVGISNGHYRVVGGSGQPYLYRAELFEILDPNVPEDWVRRDYEDGEYFIDPPELSDQFFYEDYFDGVPEAVLAYRKYIASLNGSVN